MQEHLGNRFDFTGQRQRERQREDKKGMPKFEVELKRVVDDSYEIEIGHGLVDQVAADLNTGWQERFINLQLLQTAMWNLCMHDTGTKAGRRRIPDGCVYLPAGEKSKTRQTKAMLEDAMLEKGYRRDCCILAVGGGVVTDLAGFVAGTYGRGVPFINYATSLLAAADASVGGKTAVDTPLANESDRTDQPAAESISGSGHMEDIA